MPSSLLQGFLFWVGEGGRVVTSGEKLLFFLGLCVCFANQFTNIAQSKHSRLCIGMVRQKCRVSFIVELKNA